jgi:hypothetical protein
MKMTNLNQVADELQAAFCKMATGRSYDLSILGSDFSWNLPENFNALPFNNKQDLIVNLAVRKFGELPYSPKLSEDNLREIQA